MNNTAFNHYLTFLAFALFGQTNISDQIYADVGNDVDMVAKELNYSFPILSSTIYRGILLEPKDIKFQKVKAISHIKSISFTTDLSQALIFADPTNYMSLSVMARRPKSKGYIIEESTDGKLILFHWLWGEHLPLQQVFAYHQINWEEPPLYQTQQEVIIKNQNQQFKVHPYELYLEE